MPELPEVENWRQLAEDHVVGKRIRSVATRPDKIVFEGVSNQTFARKLKGRLVSSAKRRGKYLWLELDERPWPMFHFGMTGAFRVYEQTSERHKYWKAELLMEDGTRLGMSNSRRLGRIRLQEDPMMERPCVRLGYDPLSDPPPKADLVQKLRKRKAPIKAALLDQSLFAGVGNWIADEVLYHTQIHPTRRLNTLTEPEVKALLTSLRRIIKKAVSVRADDSRFPRNWLFHYRWGKAKGAKTYEGEPIEFMTVGGRTTAVAKKKS